MISDKTIKEMKTKYLLPTSYRSDFETIFPTSFYNNPESARNLTRLALERTLEAVDDKEDRDKLFARALELTMCETDAGTVQAAMSSKPNLIDSLDSTVIRFNENVSVTIQGTDLIK
jgi:hypothetical protein